MANYGSIPGETRAQNGTTNTGDEETAALLGNKSEGSSSVRKRFHTHMTSNVSNAWGDIALLGSYIITGLLDSCSVFIWGSFLSMQTGNTIYLGLGLADPYASSRWQRSGTSVVCFCLGSFIFARYHRYFGPRKRWVLVSSYGIQLLLIVAAALMVTLGPETGTTGPMTIFIGMPIALIAFQSAGQAVTSRVLAYNSMTGVVLTSIYCDLFSDAKLFSPPSANAERNRRAAAPVLLLIGAVFGGLWAHSSIGLTGALWTAVVLKSFIVLAWCCWSAEDKSLP
ncbi:hypothetical protein LTR37_004871 [Vermiconidia calcicola]|uniref:Uncharacterized protein n=1 Tax=Vermiconidia calcicola TaxID=1690605 RepID=A0ACC3NNF1_9PEZI|nr:hypothetical protein LTR37_004871 [Vermiconidia calcicola]